MSTVVGLALVGIAFLVGIERLHDNSFLTHLATGRLIVDEGAIPRADPYTFTAGGEPWVVQSWLFSWVVARLEDAVGLNGVRVLIGTLFAVITAILWRLSAPVTSLVARLAVMALVVATLAGFVAERPLMVGLLGVALCVLAAEGRLDPRWLVPVAWIWVSSHGSFPFGGVVIGVSMVGMCLDRRDAAVPLRALAWFTLGVALGAVNPLGLRLLTFPVALLGRSSILRDHIVEWQPLSLGSGSQITFVVLAVLATAGVVRTRSWRDALVVVVFVAAGVLSRRNVPIAVIALVPVLVRATPSWGTISGGERPRLARPLMATLVVVLALVAVVSLDQPPTAFIAYPVAEIDHLQAAGDVGPGAAARVMAPDYVGNYLSARYGREAHSFIDDRYDLFPLDLIEDYALLIRPDDPDLALGVLDAHEIDVVLWRSDEPLHDVVSAAEDWTSGPDDGTWTIHCRLPRTAACSG